MFVFFNKWYPYMACIFILQAMNVFNGMPAFSCLIFRSLPFHCSLFTGRWVTFKVNQQALKNCKSLGAKLYNFLIIFNKMAQKIYIFIFLYLYLSSIESAKGLKGEDACGNCSLETGRLQMPTGSFARARHLADDPGALSDSVPVTLPFVVINEIMADPTPVAGLPDREYLELFNRHTYPVNLKGWVLGFGSKQKVLPDISVPSGGFLLVSATGGTKDLLKFGRVTEISGLTLTNSGLTVSLFDPQKKLQDQVEYEPSMHKIGCEDGGYSLERIDPDRVCGQHCNWATTLSERGGTPGTENTVKASNPDQKRPYIVSKSLIDFHILVLQLSERFIFPANAADGLKDNSTDMEIDSVCPDNKFCLLRIYFRPTSIRNGNNYSIMIHGLIDECGNVMADQTVKFGYYMPVQSDILINEVLFNPFPDGADFVELYNNSGHEVDLSGLYLATRDESNVLKQISPLASRQIYMPEDSYLAVTKSVEGILRFYRSRCDSCVLETVRFPILVDQSGCVVLLNQENVVIDEMKYSDSMHHSFITDTEGISLERVTITQPSTQRSNWHSAAKNAGFATPGYGNSVMAMPDSAKNGILIENAVFSPNGDGINDRLNICLNGINPGALLNIRIFNREGLEVRNLSGNLTTGSSDRVVWDGLGDDYKMVQPGIYVLFISLFDQKGSQKTVRGACVVTDHL
jgi:hypothetical protein